MYKALIIVILTLLVVGCHNHQEPTEPLPVHTFQVNTVAGADTVKATGYRLDTFIGAGKLLIFYLPNGEQIEYQPVNVISVKRLK